MSSQTETNPSTKETSSTTSSTHEVSQVEILNTDSKHSHESNSHQRRAPRIKVRTRVNCSQCLLWISLGLFVLVIGFVVALIAFHTQSRAKPSNPQSSSVSRCQTGACQHYSRALFDVCVCGK